MFDKFNKVAKSDTFLHNLKFDMAVTNPKKIFDLFFAKFILAIVPLDFINWYKISNS